MNAELVVKAIVDIGKADEQTLPAALQHLADSLAYKHAAIVEAERGVGGWVPLRTVCRSGEFRRACRSVITSLCESGDPVRMYAARAPENMSASERETSTYAAAGILLDELCHEDRKTVLLLVSDDAAATLSDMEKRLLSTVGTLVSKGLAGKELELAPDPADVKFPEAIGIVSHDLRTPVGTILGYSEVLLNGKRSGEMKADQRYAISKIRDNSLYILHLLGNLLDSAQIDSGKVTLSPRPWDVGAVIYNSVDRCRVQAESKSIKLEVQLDSPGLRARMDHHKIGQVLDNLITNAIKFSDSGTVVRIGARAAGAFVEVRVKDEGRGIAEGEVPSLFKRFSRTSTRGTAGEKSFGLGLYIVSELVKMHGGYVSVDTELDRGSTFAFMLPAEAP